MKEFSTIGKNLFLTSVTNFLRFRKGWNFTITLLLFGVIFIACGKGNENGSGAVKSPYKPVSKTTTLNYNITRLNGSTAEAVIQYGGSVQFAGETWDDSVGSYTTPEGEMNVHIYGKLIGSYGAKVAGYKVDYPSGSSDTDYTVTFDAPVTLDTTKIPLDKEQTQDLSGTITFADNRPSIHGKVSATYTKTTEDATIDTDFGTVSGVQVYEGSMTLVEGEGWSLLDFFRGIKFTGRVMFHPTLGILKIEVDDLPLGVAMTGQYDCGDPSASDYNTIQKVGEVSTENPTFTLSSYDCSGQFDADKYRHATMLVELRWADSDKAKTTQQPMVETEFTTIWGYFPYTFVQSPTSIFHPEENGQGYTYWYAYVDEGAKNEPGENGISYGVEVRFPDYMTSPVRVTARIKYPIYRP
jgi:hypothetical protein